MSPRREAGAKRRHPGIRWRLFAGMTAFTVLVLILVWIFQIRLLGYFYEKERFDEMRAISSEISGYLGDEALATQVERISMDEGVCIRVFRIEGSTHRQIANAEVSLDCIIHHV